MRKCVGHYFRWGVEMALPAPVPSRGYPRLSEADQSMVWLDLVYRSTGFMGVFCLRGQGLSMHLDRHLFWGKQNVYMHNALGNTFGLASRNRFFAIKMQRGISFSIACCVIGVAAGTAWVAGQIWKS